MFGSKVPFGGAMPPKSGLEGFKASAAPGKLVEAWKDLAPNQDTMVCKGGISVSLFENDLPVKDLKILSAKVLQETFVLVDEENRELDDIDVATRDRIIQQNYQVVAKYFG